MKRLMPAVLASLLAYADGPSVQRNGTMMTHEERTRRDREREHRAHIAIPKAEAKRQRKAAKRRAPSGDGGGEP